MERFFRFGDPRKKPEQSGAAGSRGERVGSALPSSIVVPANKAGWNPLRRPAHGIRAEATSGGIVEITIYGTIGKIGSMDDDDPGRDATTITAGNIRKRLDRVAPFERILIRVNSAGGDTFEAIAIHNLLRSLKRPIDCVVDGLAASAATLIVMCGDTITMGTGAMMMIHNAWGMCISYADDMDKQGDALRRISTSAADVYVKRTGRSLASIQKLMDAETWLNGQECIEMGFATAIASRPTEEDAALAAAARDFDLTPFRNVPVQLRKRFEQWEDAALLERQRRLRQAT